MSSQTSVVATQARLAQWANDIKDCQNRPAGMKIDEWCSLHNVTKANYYYRLRKVREACLATIPHETEPTFLELPVPKSDLKCPEPDRKIAAVLHTCNGMSLDICSDAPAEFIQALIGALSHAK